MATVNYQDIEINVLSTAHGFNYGGVISSGDTDAYILKITYTDITSFDGTVELYFVNGSSSWTRDASDGVTVDGNVITYTMEEDFYASRGLVCYVRHINSAILHTTLKISFSGIREVPNLTETATSVSYPAWVTSVVAAEADRAAAEGLRVLAEESRDAAEGLRDTAEGLRDTAEGLRESAETAREDAEGLRESAETAREDAEGLRVTAESARVDAEDARAVWEEWDGVTAWKAGNKVTHSGSSWVAINDNTGSEPPSADWLMIASIGASGTIDTSTLTDLTGLIAGDGTNIRAATAEDGDALPVTGGTLGAQLSAIDVQLAETAQKLKTEIENQLLNPNFSDVSDWTAGGGSIAVADNVLSVTSNATSFDPRAQQNTTLIPYLSGDKVYIKGRFKPTNAAVDAVRVWLYNVGMTSVYYEIKDFILNEWNDISVEIPFGAGGTNPFAGIWLSFHTNSLVSAKVGEIEKVFAYNLTQGEVTKETIDKLLSYYPDNWYDNQEFSKFLKYLIDKPDMEKIEVLETEVIKAQKKNRKTDSNSVCITFDGSWENPISSGAIEALENIGGKATFFPNSTVLNTSNFMTDAQLLDLYNKGHEIGVYGSDSSANLLTSMTDSEIDTMLKARQNDIALITGKKPRTMAPPQGSANLNVYKIATRYFERVRLTNLRWFSDKENFACFAHPSVVDSTVQKAIQAIEHASKNGKDLILVFHTIQPSGGVSIENFNLILKAIVDNNMRCATMEKTIKRYNLIDDPWFEIDTDATYNSFGWVTATSGGTAIIKKTNDLWGNTVLQFNGAGTGYGRADMRIPVNPMNKDYILTIPYKLTGRTAGSLIASIRYEDAIGTYLSSQAIVESADTDWKNGKLECILPDGAMYATIRLEASNLNAGAIGYYARPILNPKYAGDLASAI